MTLHCLNLPRATERRRQVEQTWGRDRGFDLTFFPAFDRRQIEAGEPLPFPYDAAATVARIRRPLSSGEIACAISHAQLLRAALDAGHEELLVLEDDMVPLAGTTAATVAAARTACREAFPRVSVLLLHEADSEHTVAETRAGIRLLRRAPYGYRFVWLARKAMEILARDLATLHYPADWLWSLRFAPMKTVAMTEQPFARHPGDTTYIGNAFRGAARPHLP